MGCWNETCFLTGLPVFAGQPAKLMFIAATADGRWLPASLPVDGSYDGYGGIENAMYDGAAASVLASARFRVVHGGGHEPEPFDASRLAGPDQDQALRELANHSAREELELLVADGNPIKSSWRPAIAVMAHAWAWDHIVDSIRSVPEDPASSVTFRLGTADPLRSALRDAAYRDEPDKNLMTAAVGLAKLMDGMQDMRLTFHPAAGKGSQDAMDAGWQLEFQKKRLVAALSAAHRHDEQEQPPFCLETAWDGIAVTSVRNGGIPSVTDMPEGGDPGALWARLLETALDALLAAMDGTEDGD